MIPQKVILVSCEPGIFTLWARSVRDQDCICCCAQEMLWDTFWITLVDMGLIGSAVSLGSWVMGWFINLYFVLKNRVFGNLGCPGKLIPYIPSLFQTPDPLEIKFSTLIPKVPTIISDVHKWQHFWRLSSICKYQLFHSKTGYLETSIVFFCKIS